MTGQSTMVLVPNLKASFGAGGLTLEARVGGDCHPEGTGRRLEAAFGDVVIVLTVKIFNVKAHAAIAGQGMEELLEEFGIHFTDLVAQEIYLPDQVRTLAEVDRGPAKSLIHRNVGVPEPIDAGKIAKRLLDRLANHNPRILDGVVEVDVQVAFGLDG